MKGYLVYHPKRCVSKFGNLVVYHDKIRGNQDPYVWNESFLHTYCHITQMSPDEGDINFWVSGDRFPAFTRLTCDLVFVVNEKLFWKNPNAISSDDSLVDSEEAYADHYKWVYQHHFKRRQQRFTLKADPTKSFQPQTETNELLDVLPFFRNMGLKVTTLRRELRAGTGSRPFPLNGSVTLALYNYLNEHSHIKLKGKKLAQIRKMHPELESIPPRSRR